MNDGNAQRKDAWNKATVNAEHKDLPCRNRGGFNDCLPYEKTANTLV